MKIEEYLYMQNNKYTVYKLSEKDTSYYLSIPKKIDNKSNLFLCFPNEELKEQQIKAINDMLIKIDQNSVFLLCNISWEDINEFSIYNDGKVNLYRKLHNKILSVIRSSFNILNDMGTEIKTPITAIKQNDKDSKLIDWLEINLGKNIKSIKYSTIKKKYNDIIFNETSAFPIINNDTKTKKLVLDSKSGFSNVISLSLLLFISFVIGIGITYLILKIKLQ